MNIYDILSLLQRFGRTEGPDRSGNYKCHCPAHKDNNASLSVKDGDKGIVFKCHANCSTDKICEALGISVKDLMHEDLPPRTGKQDNGLKPWERIEKKYAYTDEHGNVLYWNVRLHSPKDFRQTRPDPQNPDRMKWSLDKNMRKVLYRLPELLDTIKRGESVFIVEGEKDADTMYSLGYCGATNSAGGGQAWEDEYNRELTGARHIYILGDNDKTGYRHMLDVYDSMKSYRQIQPDLPEPEMIILKKVWAEIPKKGDISDMVAEFGADQADRMLRNAARMGATHEEVMAEWRAMGGEEAPAQFTAPPSPPAQDEAKARRVIPEADRTEAGKVYGEIDGYLVSGGCLYAMGKDSFKQLTTFTAIPRRMVTKDDGENVTTAFEIEGWNRDGKSLGMATVRASEYAGMGWVAENWGFEANMMPGNTIKDKVRFAMSEVGRSTATQETVYTHTGWRNLGGELVYLHGAGAIGKDGVRVELEGKLDAYDMSLDCGMSYEEACVGSMSLFMVMKPHVVYPIMAMAYLAPLVSFMEKRGCAPRFGLWLLGATQSGKTTAAMLCLSHFGNFNSQDKIPASFTDTANSVQRSAFLLKDAPILVDDYFPVSNSQEKRKMEAMAQALSRAVGNGASRGRLNSDMKQRSGYKPRGVTIFTGEDTPDIKESGIARFFLVNVKRGDVEMDDTLTILQEQASEGMLTTAMRGYIEWLSGQAETLGEALYERYKYWRGEAKRNLSGAGARAGESLACLMVATEMMLSYWMSTGAIDADTARAMQAEALKVNCDTSRTQAREARDQKPTMQFLEIVRELIASGANKCLDTGEDSNSINVIGFQDKTFYYLMPELTYKAVSKFCADQGTAFPITLAMLRKQFVEERVLSDEYTNRLKKIRGRTARYMWIPRELIDGREEAAKQTDMTETEEEAPFA